MANKAISELPQAQNVNNQDLFVLEQSGIAKKLTAETFITEQGIIDALAEALDGHGGIQSVTLSSVSGRVRTYLITFTDESATTFQVYDGTTIERIAKTSTAGLVDTYTVFMNDGTTTFFTVTNGADGTVSEAMLNDALKDKAPAITETTESSAIANFSDGADNMPMQNVVAEIDPVQDLHGYDSPWPAGGSINLAQKVEVYDQIGITVSVAYDGTITINGTATTTNFIRGRIVFADLSATYTWATFNNAAFNSGVEFSLRNADYSSVGGWAKADAVNKTNTFTINAGATPAWWQIQINTGTTFNNFVIKPMVVLGSTAPTTYLPYSNICPISGWTGCNVTRTGKNLFPIQIEPLRAWATDRQDMVAFMNTLKAGTYTLSCVNKILSVRSEPAAAEFMLGVWLRNSAIGNQSQSLLECRTAITSSQEVAGFSATSTRTITITEAMVGNFNHFYLYSGDNRGNATSSFDIQLELGSTATAYEPYQGTTLAIDWSTEAGTVYGGTIDVATGVLTVDREMVDLGTLTWVASETGNGRYYAAVNGIKLANPRTLEIICSCFKPNVGGGAFENCSIYNVESRLYAVNNNFIDDASGFTESVTEQVAVYPLATPQTYQLTPQEVKTLLGTNNVWTDVGNVSVTYPADTKLYIEKLTMPTEDDLVANQAITSGKYFMVGNSLYLALANIASGAQITIGTNAQRVSLADALNTINS